jgi:hypothetical protein
MKITGIHWYPALPIQWPHYYEECVSTEWIAIQLTVKITGRAQEHEVLKLNIL